MIMDEYEKEIATNLATLHFELVLNDVNFSNQIEQIHNNFRHTELNRMCAKYGEDKRERFRASINIIICIFLYTYINYIPPALVTI